MNTAPTPPPLSVARALAGKRILLTGASGFLGKVALLRLLDACPDVARVTLLLRGNADEGPHARWQTIVASSPAFGPLRERFGEQAGDWIDARVEVVAGDIAHPDLHLDPDVAARLRSELDLVVHCAALVDFDPDIRLALASNAIGALMVGAFATSCERARLLHVSTCYVAGYREGRIEEQPVGDRTPSGRAFDVDAELDALEQAIAETEAEHGGDPPTRVMVELGRERAQALGWPNSYTYTKALAEGLVSRRYPSLTHAVLRPSIVESALAFPFPGWNEGYNTCGPLAYLVGTWFKALPARGANPFDVVPVDLVAAGLWIAAARVLEGDAPPVFQCGTSQRNPLTLGRALELTQLEQRRHLRASGATLADRQLRSRVDTVAFDDAHPLSLDRLAEGMRHASDLLRKVPKSWPEPVRKEAGSWSRTLTRRRRTLSGIDKTVQAFTPFIRDIRQWFVTEALVARDVVEPELAFAPEQIDWRRYWIDTHMPGMRRWCFPELERDLR